MSQPDLALARSIFTAWERGDFYSLGWAHAEIELVVVDGPEPTRSRGLRTMLQHWSEFVSRWDGRRIVVDDYRALDGGRVLVLTDDQARNAPEAHVVDIRDGMVARLVIYSDRRLACKHLGLSAEDEVRPGSGLPARESSRSASR